MRRIRDGEPAAFGVLYARHAGAVLGLPIAFCATGPLRRM